MSDIFAIIGVFACICAILGLIVWGVWLTFNVFDTRDSLEYRKTDIRRLEHALDVLAARVSELESK